MTTIAIIIYTLSYKGNQNIQKAIFIKALK